MENDKMDSAKVQDYLDELIPNKSNPEDVSNKTKMKTYRDYVGRDKIHVENKSDGQNNVINLNVGGVAEKEDKKLSGKTITWQQEEEIRALVRKIDELSEFGQSEIWRKFSAHFDGLHYKKLPKERYREAAQWLNDWADELKEISKCATKPVDPAAAKPEITPMVSPNCSQCKKAEQKIASTRKALTTSVVCGVLALGAASYLGFKSYVLTGKNHALDALFRVCQYGGKPYTIGSVIDNLDAADVECVASTDGQSPQWQQTMKPSLPVKRVSQRK